MIQPKLEELNLVTNYTYVYCVFLLMFHEYLMNWSTE